jgi:ATP-dependent RNA helicase SUPV3L1/SUV3
MSSPKVPVKAVLGPTNTGKTHLAVERLCAHSSGVMGFPLRLLAREIYDRVVAIKGPKEVALITGEERIEPPGARWYLCTAESMPVERQFAFAFALDEAQLGADPERGHIFTDRMLHVRGREETMILGSESLRPMVRALLPEAEIISRPRFSTLSYSGPKKLSRLPQRSAIVAFSVEQVYAVAELLRRLRGGAAVVMGALSPRTRNAQVEMFQSGEVDYLVATDAIGMGLNLDVQHIAFAGLSKFDGNRTRRLTIAEMAQIAGRAGRHQRDGTFGTWQAKQGNSLRKKCWQSKATNSPRLTGCIGARPRRVSTADPIDCRS